VVDRNDSLSERRSAKNVERISLDFKVTIDYLKSFSVVSGSTFCKERNLRGSHRFLLSTMKDGVQLTTSDIDNFYIHRWHLGLTCSIIYRHLGFTGI
jgi:hypothetical protein